MQTVIITNRRNSNAVKNGVGNHRAVLKSFVRYLGILIDAKLRHLDYTRERKQRPVHL